MAYVKPDEVVRRLVDAGVAKAALADRDLLVRGFFSGALLGFATTLAASASLQTGFPLVGAALFPAGFVMVVLLGMELVTGNFAVLPLAAWERRIAPARVWRNWGWVYAGNLLGAATYALLLTAAVAPDSGLARQLAAVAEAKTAGYASVGVAGLRAAFVRAVLGNWMVTLGVVLSQSSESTGGKMAAMWLPILTFFAQGFEHAVVNMFVIPAGMLLGARVTVADWWLWNQLPVTLGNLVGGLVFTGLGLYVTHRPREADARARAAGLGPVATP